MPLTDLFPDLSILSTKTSSMRKKFINSLLTTSEIVKVTLNTSCFMELFSVHSSLEAGVNGREVPSLNHCNLQCINGPNVNACESALSLRYQKTST